MSKIQTELLLQEDDNRYVMFPIQDQDIWQMYKKQVECFWRAEEIDLSKDMAHWESLNEKERYFISMILAFFAAIKSYLASPTSRQVFLFNFFSLMI